MGFKDGIASIVGDSAIDMGRRGFLRLAAAVAVTPPTLLMADSALAAGSGFSQRRLRMDNINTGESFDGVYWRDGVYVPEALRRLDLLMRDHRAGKATHMDPRLFDALWSVARGVDADGCCYKMVCGYRTTSTNAAKRRRSRGVAKDSYHTKGMAVDVVLDGRSLGTVAREAKALSVGGVGLYGRSGFVHMDVGPVRSW